MRDLTSQVRFTAELQVTWTDPGEIVTFGKGTGERETERQRERERERKRETERRKERERDWNIWYNE